MSAGRVESDDVAPLAEWRLHAGHQINIWLSALVVVLVLALLADYLAGPSVAWPLVLLLLLGAVPSLLVAVRALLRQRRLRVVLTPTQVHNVGIRSVERVLLADVRAVVVARLVRDTWTTWLILDDGEAVRLVAPAFVFWSRLRSRRSGGSDEQEIASSPSGRQASALHAAVTNRPGGGTDQPVDELVRRSQVGPRVLRYWSPADHTAHR